MTAGPDQLAIERHDAQDIQQLRNELLTVYQEVYTERLTDPFFYPDRFWQRLEGYASRNGFRLVAGRVEGEFVGFTLGSILSADTSWWDGFKSNVNSDFLHETGRRTFCINELQVRPAWRRRGYAKALSAVLLEGLLLERATLLVRAENTAACTAYKSWGFRTVGHLQPFDDSPVYEAMVKELL